MGPRSDRYLRQRPDRLALVAFRFIAVGDRQQEPVGRAERGLSLGVGGAWGVGGRWQLHAASMGRRFPPRKR